MTDTKLPPDLSLNPLNARVVGNGSMWYDSQAALADDRHIPKQVLKQARKLGASGFQKNNSVNWAELQPWLAANYQGLATVLNEDGGDRNFWQTEKLKEEVKRLRRENKAEENTYINRKAVLNALEKHLNELFASIERSLVHELLAKYELILRDTSKTEEEKLSALRQLNMQAVTALFKMLKGVAV